MFTRLLQNTGNMTLLFTVDTAVDKQHHKWRCLKNDEWRENGVMHLPAGSSAQMINHERVTTKSSLTGFQMSPIFKSQVPAC
jgi:hypothetical protein